MILPNAGTQSRLIKAAVSEMSNQQFRAAVLKNWENKHRAQFFFLFCNLKGGAGKVRVGEREATSERRRQISENTEEFFSIKEVKAEHVFPALHPTFLF